MLRKHNDGGAGHRPCCAIREVKKSMLWRFGLVAAVLAACWIYSQERDALEVQKARNEHVRSRRDLHYSRKFNLDGLPHYKPEQQISGTIRMAGSNSVADGHAGEYWEQEFRKFHPNVKFEYNLKT